MNGFLCAYIDRSLPTYHYYIRNRYLLEKIFNYEFQIGIEPGLAGYMDSLFFVGKYINYISISFDLKKIKIMKKRLRKYYFMVKKIVCSFGISLLFFLLILSLQIMY